MLEALYDHLIGKPGLYITETAVFIYYAIIHTLLGKAGKRVVLRVQ